MQVDPPSRYPNAFIRMLFVNQRVDRVVIDGLLHLEPASVGVPTAWSFACPDHPVLAAATLHVLERWADDGMPVALDLTKVASSHPSVGFARDEVLVRLSVLPRSGASAGARTVPFDSGGAPPRP